MVRGKALDDESMDDLVHAGKENYHEAEHVKVFPAHDKYDKAGHKVYQSPDDQPADCYIACDMRVLDVFPEDGEKIYHGSDLKEPISNTGEGLAGTHISE
jgi:hypothetical protein